MSTPEERAELIATHRANAMYESSPDTYWDDEFVAKLADALAEVEAENARLRDDFKDWEEIGAPRWVEAHATELGRFTAERDALQSKLDAVKAVADEMPYSTHGGIVRERIRAILDAPTQPEEENR